MKYVLPILQVLLAIHTAIGAFWKFGNAENIVPVLRIIPVEVWHAISIAELGAALLLVLPLFLKQCRARIASYGALLITIEMLAFSAILLFSGSMNYSPMYYWLVVAAVAGFIAYKRCP